MKFPKVSIVTSSYNKADYLLQAIESVKKQSYQPIEHIVIDGGSDDGTLAMLKGEKSSHLVWISEKDSGQYEAVNKGFRMSRGEIIGWLDADDTYNRDSVTVVMHYMDTHPEIDFVYGDYNFIDDKGRLIKRHYSIDFDYPVLLYNKCYISPQSVFFRKRVLEKIGFLNEDLKLVGDYDFFLRMARQCRPAYIRYCVGNYRVTAESFTQNPGYRRLFKTERFSVRKKHAGLEKRNNLNAGFHLEIKRHFYRVKRYLKMLKNHYERVKLAKN